MAIDQTERTHLRDGLNRAKWGHGLPLPGTFTTAETPAQGYFAEGSAIPPGRFVALSPSTMASRSQSWNSVILPDNIGADLMQQDGTDYTGIIADAQNAAGDLEIVGVSVDYACSSDCEREWGQMPCPPIGYVDEAMRWKFFRPADGNKSAAEAVSVVHNDHVWVYTEVDMKPGDPIFIRVEITDPFDKDDPTKIPQLFGGVNQSEGIDITTTMFATARIAEPAIAGGAVKIYLG